MTAATLTHAPRAHAPGQSPTGARVLIGIAVVTTALFIAAPMAYIFVRAFSQGWQVYAANILHPMTLHAIWLTTITAIIVVPLNVAFGIAAAWAVAKHRFPGRGLWSRSSRSRSRSRPSSPASPTCCSTEGRGCWDLGCRPTTCR